MADDKAVMPIAAFQAYLERTYPGKELSMGMRDAIERAYLGGMVKAIGEYMDEEIAQANADKGECLALSALDEIEARYLKKGWQ